jgi:hypothetical protein
MPLKLGTMPPPKDTLGTNACADKRDIAGASIAPRREFGLAQRVGVCALT